MTSKSLIGTRAPFSFPSRIGEREPFLLSQLCGMRSSLGGTFPSSHQHETVIFRRRNRKVFTAAALLSNSSRPSVTSPPHIVAETR
jgi:hypothetical protein